MPTPSTPIPFMRAVPTWSVCGLKMLERGWLSSNVMLFDEGDDIAIVDTGYVLHAEQTWQWVQHQLGERPLCRIINTHLHSDHCGGNAFLAINYPKVETWVPWQALATVQQWDETQLTYQVTGQACSRFQAHHGLKPPQTLLLSERIWHLYPAPGHDPQAVMLFEPEHRVLITGDALWEHGFGVVFPEIMNQQGGFEAVRATLKQIEALQPQWILPGHGAPFGEVQASLERAYQRLARFERDPQYHRHYAQKVLLKFKLLACQSLHWDELLAWCATTPFVRELLDLKDDPLDKTQLIAAVQGLIGGLVHAGAAKWQDAVLWNEGG